MVCGACRLRTSPDSLALRFGLVLRPFIRVVRVRPSILRRMHGMHTIMLPKLVSLPHTRMGLLHVACTPRTVLMLELMH